MKAKKKVIAIVGMPGSGKALASTVAVELGYPVYICGDVIREEVERRGFPPTSENVGRVMFKVREEEGYGVVAKRLIPKISSSSSRVVVVEGVRNIEEVNELKKLYDVKIVAIQASPTVRFRRLVARGRSDDPRSWDDFQAREKREVKVGIGRVIDQADLVLVNEGTVEELKTKFKDLLERFSQDG